MSFRAFEIMANLAKRRPLRGIQAVCETQHQISTRKLEQYVEIAGNELADYAFNLRNEFDKIERERNAALAECERLRSLWELELDRATTAENESAINQWALDEARRVLGKCQEMLDPHRDAVLWGEVCDAFKVKP